MWPWEHAIVGYLVYSLSCRVLYRDAPGGLETLAVVVGSLAPDLVDKPLAWEFGVFDGGYALGHSIFVALPLSVLLATVARAAGRPRVGLAVALGYLLHLPADLLDVYVREGVGLPGLVLWPIASVEDRGVDRGFVDYFLQLFGQYRADLLAGDLPTYLWMQLGLAVAAAVLWLADGAPVLRECLTGCRRLVYTAIDPDGSPEDPRERR